MLPEISSSGFVSFSVSCRRSGAPAAVALNEQKPSLVIIMLLTFPLHSNFKPVFLLIFAFLPLLSSQTTNRSISYLTFHARFAYHQTLLPSYTMANPDVGASDAQQKINQELQLYSALITNFIRTHLMTTTRDKERSIALKRFARFYPLEDDPLHGKNGHLPIADLHGPHQQQNEWLRQQH